MIYKFYKSQVTGSGFMPEGNCLATLTLDEARNPTWSEVAEEFERLCLPWFDQTVRLGVMDNLAPLKPYSDEALQHLSKQQLPSQGFIMVKVGTPPKAPPSSFGFQSPTMSFSPPPGLFKTPPAALSTPPPPAPPAGETDEA
jgi:hypothetical protein